MAKYSKDKWTDSNNTVLTDFPEIPIQDRFVPLEGDLMFIGSPEPKKKFKKYSDRTKHPHETES